jgi:hypothetical protein
MTDFSQPGKFSATSPQLLRNFQPISRRNLEKIKVICNLFIKTKLDFDADLRISATFRNSPQLSATSPQLSANLGLCFLNIFRILLKIIKTYDYS